MIEQIATVGIYVDDQQTALRFWVDQRRDSSCGGANRWAAWAIGWRSRRPAPAPAW